MIKVNFYEFDKVDDNRLKFAVIVSRHNGQWVFARHKDRNTWEIPGGHREENEKIISSAKRELYEETGAIDFDIKPICIYAVQRGEIETFGALFYSEIYEMGDLPELEIEEVKFFDEIPDNLTYPFIQVDLFNKVLETIKTK